MKILMEMSVQFFTKHRLSVSEAKSKIMNYDSVTGKTTFTIPESDGDSIVTLENYN